MSAADKEARRDKLVGLTGVDSNNFITTQFCRVPFLQALGLISMYMEGGYAFVPVINNKVKHTICFLNLILCGWLVAGGWWLVAGRW